MGGAPSVPTDSRRELQVIGAGYSRTGTVSMGMALEQLLQGPVMHGGTQILGREDAYAKLWTRIFAERKNKPVLMKLLKEATEGFVGLTDSPGSLFLEELLELYPNCKVVLVKRDIHAWYKSMQPIMENTQLNPLLFRALLLPIPTWRWFPKIIQGMGSREIERLNGVPFTPDMLLTYNDWVRAHVRPEKLMEMEMAEGWEPLAKFLNTTVPSTPFPRANDAAAMTAYINRILITASLAWLGIFTVLGLACWLSWTSFGWNK
ncbi:hypothetical protein QQS21_005517 [Conoideocrella luteorostrata]|uniref:NAD dependent epimerase/dehydratase n=1 Tax=Conoideocrella luteorostrata TaxID=1105319 RepID=A0AAJ0CRV1_9HYPO|nr:hypothetical protein QQS21_005517 [Conoideocrella luteorostrata]